MSLLEKRNQLKQEKQAEETPQMSIGQQLEIMSKVKEIEYQNSLVMMSLEKYNEKFKELKTEQIEQLESMKSQVNQLKRSNTILGERIEESLKELTAVQKAKISSLVDNSNKVLESTEKGLNEKVEEVRKATEKFISDCEENKKRTNERYKSFFDRWKWLDFVIMIDLVVMPIIIIILAYRILSK